MLGHINFKYVETLCNKKLVYGMPEKLENEHMKCTTCIENKIHKVPFKNDRRKATQIFEIVHTDLNGPQSTVGNCGVNYYVTLTDDYSKQVKIYLFKII